MITDKYLQDTRFKINPKTVQRVAMSLQCLKCKGRNFCGKGFCELNARARSLYRLDTKLAHMHSKLNLDAHSPSVFIGHTGYPKVNVGLLSTQDNKAWKYDAPKYWAKQEYNIEKIVGFRSSLLNSKEGFDIKAKGRVIEAVREVSMSVLPVDIELDLKSKPKFNMKFDEYSAPLGPSAILKKVDIVSNPKIPKPIESAVSDVDWNATSAMKHLFSSGIDENTITKLLSVGNLGIGKNRRLVPTRWSITAVDDSLGKDLIGKIQDYQSMGNVAYFGGYLGNYFLILTFPDIWGFELFEMVEGVKGYTTDHEFHYGRKTYASNCAGGYYATRLPVLSKLNRLRKKSTVIALRFITNEYSAPLGVWVVREAVRKALNNKPIEFSDEKLMIDYALLVAKKRFGTDISELFRQSRLLSYRKTQKRLSDFR